ncbi:Tether containing UBX domain for GLUT4 [Trachymyrmex septentrionalis]|uniref:Tether containing UBX domain for GLUT4 n=1 Tax=Trachymyrmex septentrionalis TaxID=34720 RepID=A0A195ET84_9HYME|nr:PREDICTED: tether containing UBX domain for GLUT4 [Trachymyrmex septentrionalis]KYN31443.1 Tether containing UBX domain for GLUT4 [Trachymyrmex septentrionalis]
MAVNKTVIVLAPNGRRQNVKVTINTTILQVLEEVCQKQGYNVDDYDIKHNRQILDPNTIFRFTGLPNNAQLEMVACTKTRTTSNVTIGIQPEDGQRILREFSPDTTLAQALMEMYPDSDLERAVLIYMHREVCGKEALEKTTLKSLGLNSGKAILRLIYRDHEQLKTQAHVSTPLLPKSVANDSSSNRRVPSSSSHCSKTINETINLLTESTSKIENQEESRDEMKIDTKDETVNALSNKNQEKDIFKTGESHPIASSHEDDAGTNRHIAETCAEVQETAYEIKFLGKRNALVFNQAGTQALPREELPDSFFDLDLQDAKTLLRDAKRRREQLEEAPLLTEAQRQLDQNKHILDRLVKYRRAVIRIQFPDQFVLQGLFEPLETIKAIKDFIKSYLENPDCEFTIYTSPPRHILNPDTRLIDENLVPSAIVYYSGPSSLNSNVKAQLTDPRAAGIEAVKSRIATMRKEQDPTAESDRGTVVESNHVTPGPSGSGKSSSPSTQNQNKTPKWFKQTFK